MKLAEIPKGSFYHYFENKEVFGLQVAQFYHDDQIRSARLVLTDENQDYVERLYQFFSSAAKQFKEREFKQGCLMCNLSYDMQVMQEHLAAVISRLAKYSRKNTDIYIK